jgi:hypothetical protein
MRASAAVLAVRFLAMCALLLPGGHAPVRRAGPHPPTGTGPGDQRLTRTMTWTPDVNAETDP